MDVKNLGGTGVVGLLFVLFVCFIVYLKRYRTVGPNEALIVSGKKQRAAADRPALGFKIVKGGGTFVWPFIQKAEVLSLEVITIDIRTPEVYTILGVPVVVDGVAQIKINSVDEDIATAAEQFLGRGRNDIMNVATQTIEGHLRAILGTLTVEDSYRNREAFSQKVQEVASADMKNMGLRIVSFTLRDIKDNQGYLNALGQPRLAEVKRDAVVAQAQADRDSTIKSAQAKQEGESAKYAAEAKIAEANRDYELKRAGYIAQVNQAKAEADLAYDLQRYKTNQFVKKEEIQVTIIEREQMIAVQEREIQRKTKELEATVQKPADAQRYAVQTQAEAEKYKLMAEAEGKAAGNKSIGFAQADVIKATGQAEGAAIQAKGEAEATAMGKKAESWKQYNEAAVTQMFIDVLPKIAQHICEPLSKTERIVVINSGDSQGGVSKFTGDVANVISQLPPVIEALTGVNLKKLVEHIPGSVAKDKPQSGQTT